MIALGCDHGGFPLMKEVIAYLDANNIPYKNYGTFSEESVDYPVYGKLVAHAVADGECEKGILICGTGIGMSIAANKVKGVRAALCNDCYSAAKARQHNNANVLCMGARVLGPGLAQEIMEAYLNASFLGSYHEGRVEKIMALEK